MTRINIVSPSELMDQHLIAEYREITMLPASLKRTLASKVGLNRNKISDTYTLNGGHVYFFYDKGKYLAERYQALITEMKGRGFNPDSNRLFPVDIFKDNGLYNDWTPSPYEYKIIRERLDLRISQKPDWYRKTTSSSDL